MVASANWRCADCDTFNAPAETSCTVCGEDRRDSAAGAAPKAAGAARAPAAAKPAAKKTGAPRPPAKRPGSAARPTADWRCSECDTFNARTDVSCLTCGTSWKAAAKKGTPKTPKSPKSPKASSSGDTTAKKTAPRKPPAKKPSPRTGAGSTGATSASGPRPASPRPGSTGTSTRRTGTASSGTRPRTEEGVFFPSSPSTGYRPTTPTTTPVPPPRPAPVYAPPPRPVHTPPPKSKDRGCVSGCVGFLVLLFLLGLFAKGCGSAFDSSDSGGTDGTTVAGTCPARIAAELPNGDGAELVEAFRTSNKQITLCRTTSGTLYYYGEFSDGREAGIAMEAEQTSEGYEARNGPYRYEIHGKVVTIFQSGRQIGEEDLTPEPSPT
ncbi:hypothetical protein ABZT06_40505 [Streptomyces sp. NPDC005483]|uniref:hypothetical protein n=1 Tax=Streptomyces sp. NPDC005483 TaxID=3154882 RepID=UPI0033B6D3C4